MEVVYGAKKQVKRSPHLAVNDPGGAGTGSWSDMTDNYRHREAAFCPVCQAVVGAGACLGRAVG